MAYYDYLATFGAETTEFEKGADRVQHKATMLEKSLMSIGNRFFSSFIALFGLNSIMRFGGEIAKQVETIDQLSKKFHLSTNEVQLLQMEAKKLGLTFEELLKNTGDLEYTLKVLKEQMGDITFSKQEVEDVKAFVKAWQEFQEWMMKRTVRTARAFDYRKIGTEEWDLNAARFVSMTPKWGGLMDSMRRLFSGAPMIGRGYGGVPTFNFARGASIAEMEKNVFGMVGVKADEEAAKLRWIDRFEEDWEKIGDDIEKFNKEFGKSLKDLWDEAEKHDELIKKDKKEAAERDKKTADALEKGWKPETTDSLQEIGNFLGTNPRSIEQQSLFSIQRTVEAIFRKLQEPKPPVAQQNVFPK